MHLLFCLVCSPSEAAWIALPSLVAEVLTTPRLSIYCLSSSHDQWPFIFISMSSSCLGSFHSNSPDSRLGFPSLVNFLLHVVEGVGGGRLLGIPWHGLPFIRAFIKERLALSAFFSCQCCFPSASWEIDNQVDTSSFRTDRQDRVLGCLCSGWKKDALGTLSCSDNSRDSALQQEIVDLWRVSALQQEIADIAVFPLHI